MDSTMESVSVIYHKELQLAEEKHAKMQKDLFAGENIKKIIDNVGDLPDEILSMFKNVIAWGCMKMELRINESKKIKCETNSVIKVDNYFTMILENMKWTIKFADGTHEMTVNHMDLFVMISMYSLGKFDQNELLNVGSEQIFFAAKYIVDTINKLHPLKTDVNVRLSIGNYEWCGNNYDGNKSGHYLTPYNDKSSEKVLINLTTKMSKRLFREIDIIEIYHICDGGRGFCANYSTNGLNNPHKTFFELQPKYGTFGDSLIINYSKILPRDPKMGIFSRAPMKIIHTEIVKIPFLEIKGSNDCAICSGPVDSKRYITTCQHLFHSKCIFEYLDSTNKLLPLANHCVQFMCGHARKCDPFECPICKNLLEYRK